MSKNSNSRVKQEREEGLDQIKNDGSQSRMQTEQQIATTQDALNTKPKEESFALKEDKPKGSQLKQEKISDVLTGSTGTAGMGINFAGRGVSGTANGVLGANSSTPAATGSSRSATRPGKKLDRLATKLNFTPSEQPLVSVDESKPLADSAEKDQGFNGTYRNELGRSQKIMGAVPGDLMFQRSVDLITKDKLYFLEGQAVFQVGDDRDSYFPSRTWDEENAQYVDYKATYGDYLHKDFHFALDDRGKVRYFYANVEDITPENLDATIVNQASAHRLMKSNAAELDRINMDAKAGDEKAEIWSPMPRAYVQPTRIATYLPSIEAETGGYVHLAYSKASTNFSYQLNRAVKDGLDDVTPAIEQMNGFHDTSDNNKDINTAFSGSLGNTFTTGMYAAGSPALMIEAYDSVNKYRNKADLLLQPRGWRMHLQTADNNMNAFKVPAEYANVYAGMEAFSTIDHEYDPILPIVMTDKANLITATNFNQSSSFVSPSFEMCADYTKIDTGYEYTSEIIIPKHFINNCGYASLYVYGKYERADGIVYSNGGIYFDPDSTTRVGASIKIKVFTSALSAADLASGGRYYGYSLVTTISTPNAFAYDLFFAVPDVQSGDSKVTKHYTINDEELPKLYYKDGGPYVCHYHDLRNNYSVTVKHPLIFGIIEYIENSIGAKFKSLLKQNELYIPLVFSTQYMTLAQLIICAATPWITRVRINSMRDVIYYEDEIHEYPFSKLKSLRDVPFKNYVNFEFTDYDSPLQTKVLQPVNAIGWVLPEFFWKVDTYKYVTPWYMNENELLDTGAPDDDAACMSFPSIRSGVRLASLDILYGMSEKDVRLSLDRMCKDFFNKTSITAVNAYKYGRMTDGQPTVTLNSDVISVKDILSNCRELGLSMDAPLGVLTLDPSDNGDYKAFTADGTSTSFRIKFWTNVNTIQNPSILSADGVNINRAANYIQKWYELTANNASSNTMIAGLVFGLNDEVSDAEYSPFAALGSGAQQASMPTIVSFQRSLWTRLQLLPFVISPFDGAGTTTDKHDIYDLAYMFGLCGFRASDYRESVYNREKEVINQGMLFVEDPWILDSPIVNHAAKETGISETKGYKI